MDLGGLAGQVDRWIWVGKLDRQGGGGGGCLDYLVILAACKLRFV